MAFIKICISVALIACVTANPTISSSFWKGTFLDATVEEMRSMCNNDDAFACIKFKAVTFLDNLFKKDIYQLTEDVEITRNSFRTNEVSSRGDASFEENIEKYIQSHDVTLNMPVIGSTVTLGARNLEENEIDLKVKFSGNVEGRKSKLKKILIPILVFVLLKAITLIPLAIGILGLKAWNALQLSFFSFVVSVSLAIFQLCKKIASDNSHPQIAAHGAWDSGYAARSLDDNTQQMAYFGYTQE